MLLSNNVAIGLRFLRSLAYYEIISSFYEKPFKEYQKDAANIVICDSEKLRRSTSHV
jgi:hypothetical protein